MKVVGQITGGLADGYNALKNLGTKPEDYVPPDQNAAMYFGTRFADTARDQIGGNIKDLFGENAGEIAQGVYNATMRAADTIAQTLVTGAVDVAVGELIAGRIGSTAEVMSVANDLQELIETNQNLIDTPDNHTPPHHSPSP